MCLLGIWWALCFRTHNELTMCLLSKCTLAPSVWPSRSFPFPFSFRGFPGVNQCSPSADEDIVELVAAPEVVLDCAAMLEAIGEGGSIGEGSIGEGGSIREGGSISLSGF